MFVSFRNVKQYRNCLKKCQFSIATKFQRKFASLPLVVSDEIQQALNDREKPIVSLESTIITHGLPYPDNLSMATEAEKIIRANGAVPATCAFIDGIPYVGLTSQQLEYLSEQASMNEINKVSRRDIGYTMANKINGGTTIALTMILSHLAGIKVFATGGLGGVHKDGHLTMDVSADLTELGRTPVSVVCAGPKSILDIGLTMEYLETQGVFVGTYNDNNRTRVDIPGFYCRDSGIPSPYSFNSFAQAASIVHNQNNLMSLKSGNVFCIPPPEDSALPSDFINKIIENANKEAREKGIRGKSLTPFLLSKIANDTKGRSVECNINFVFNNAVAATKIAKELLSLENGSKSNNPKLNIGTKEYFSKAGNVKADISMLPSKNKVTSTNIKDHVNTVIIGSIALDTISRLNSPGTMNDSNPGQTRSSMGGVGYNVSLACKYGLESPSCLSKNMSGLASRLISVVADDFAGMSLLKQLDSNRIDTSGIKILKDNKNSTAQYTSIHNSNGDLLVACADMSIIEDDSIIDHIVNQLDRAKPGCIVLDCNISSSAMSKILQYINNNLKKAKVIIEPTSSPKAARLSQVNSKNLRVFPKNIILLVTPTIAELNTIHSSFSNRELFDDYDEWFPLLDTLGVDSLFREKLNKQAQRYEVLRQGFTDGFLQQSFQLLPYLPNILLKLGPSGLLYVGLTVNVGDYSSIPTTSAYSPEFTITSNGREFTDSDGKNKRMGIVIQYFPIPEVNRNLEIKNVTGAGDSLLGYLTARMLQLCESKLGNAWLEPEIHKIEDEWFKWESIYKAQISSGLSLQSNEAISPAIGKIK